MTSNDLERPLIIEYFLFFELEDGVKNKNVVIMFVMKTFWP